MRTAPEREVARILDDTVARALEIETDKIVPLFDAAQKRCLALVSSQNHEVEIKRRMAEQKMLAIGSRCDASFEMVKKLHNQLLQLGYTDLSREGTMEICFSRFCLARREAAIARGDLTPALF